MRNLHPSSFMDFDRERFHLKFHLYILEKLKTPFRSHFIQLIPSNLLVLSGKGRMVGDQPEGAPVKGVKRKVIVPLPVLTKSAGSGLRFHPFLTKIIHQVLQKSLVSKSHGILRYTWFFFRMIRVCVSSNY